MQKKLNQNLGIPMQVMLSKLYIIDILEGPSESAPTDSCHFEPEEINHVKAGDWVKFENKTGKPIQIKFGEKPDFFNARYLQLWAPPGNSQTLVVQEGDKDTIRCYLDCSYDPTKKQFDLLGEHIDTDPVVIINRD